MSHITALASANGTSSIFHRNTMFFIFTIAKNTTNMAANITNFAKSHILISFYRLKNLLHNLLFVVKTFHVCDCFSYQFGNCSYFGLLCQTYLYLLIKYFQSFFNFLPFFQDIQSRFDGDWTRRKHPFNSFLQTVRAHIIESSINGIIAVHF